MKIAWCLAIASGGLVAQAAQTAPTVSQSLGRSNSAAVSNPKPAAPSQPTAIPETIPDVADAIEDLAKATRKTTVVYEDVRAWALFAASLLGTLIVILSHRRELRRIEWEWYKQFGEIYDNFWRSRDMEIMRRWIASPHAYRTELRPILERRNIHPQEVPPSDYWALEVVDKFGATLTRFHVIRPDTLDESRRVLIDRTFELFWMRKVVNECPELKSYLLENWKDVMDKFISKYPGVVDDAGASG